MNNNLDRQSIFARLYKMRDNGVLIEEVTSMIKLMLSTHDTPELVLEFLNKLDTPKINPLVEKLKSKKLYKSLKSFSEKDNISDIELAKMVTSLITHSLIESEQVGISVEDIDDKFHARALSNIIYEYFKYGHIDRVKLEMLLREAGYLIKE